MSDSFLARLGARIAAALGQFNFNNRGTPIDRRALRGFRLPRSGKHRGTMLTKHEQQNNPAGTKLWKKCPLKTPEWL